ncbi:leucine-rich repeat extensin-like protein 5 [Papaver somniferum]|uniref:leucine-rich repeat extensin-like protein 5 n=1 Tax=Papaver somniferum TaxID=3469 RepID=UPI000E705155|nr:leucine-rich repeat extensin-like protein 5 [Papaver somniferum]
MADRQRVPYQTPPPSPHRSPSYRIPDISPPGGASSKSSQLYPRAQKTSSSSGLRASSVKKGDQPKGPPGSRYVVTRPSAPPRAGSTNTQTPSPHRAEPLDVPPLRSVAPPSIPHQRPSDPPPVVPTKVKYTKGTASKTDLSNNPPTKRKASDMSPPKKPSSDPADDSDASPVIQSVAVGKKKVTFKHIDLAAFKGKHELDAFEVRFYAPDGDLTYDLISKYKYDEFHLLTTVWAFEAGLMLPL